jgi:hypothetical protein
MRGTTYRSGLGAKPDENVEATLAGLAAVWQGEAARSRQNASYKAHLTKRFRPPEQAQVHVSGVADVLADAVVRVSGTSGYQIPTRDAIEETCNMLQARSRGAK